MKGLILTIEKTIKRLQGLQWMEDQELYQGFTKEKLAEYKKYLLDRVLPDDPAFAECGEKLQNWTQGDSREAKEKGDAIYHEIVKSIKKGLKPNSRTIQKIIEKHYQWVCLFWTPDRQHYIDLGTMYVDHPDFRKYFSEKHPELVEFLAEAMKEYAEQNL